MALLMSWATEHLKNVTAEWEQNEFRAAFLGQAISMKIYQGT